MVYCSKSRDANYIKLKISLSSSLKLQHTFSPCVNLAEKEVSKRSTVLAVPVGFVTPHQGMEGPSCDVITPSCPGSWRLVERRHRSMSGRTSRTMAAAIFPIPEVI